MGEGSIAPTKAQEIAMLDLETVQKHLEKALNGVMVVDAADISLEGLTVDNTRSGSKMVCEYVSQMAAHLVVYDTLPIQPENGVADDTWKYALATTETCQWRDCIVPYMSAYKVYREHVFI
jgi:hypothetical protein